MLDLLFTVQFEGECRSRWSAKCSSRAHLHVGGQRAEDSVARYSWRMRHLHAVSRNLNVGRIPTALVGDTVILAPMSRPCCAGIQSLCSQSSGKRRCRIVEEIPNARVAVKIRQHLSVPTHPQYRDVPISGAELGPVGHKMTSRSCSAKYSLYRKR